MEAMKKLQDRQTLETRYRNSRGNILLVIIFTVINLVLLVTNSNTYFLFSAYIPYILVDFGMLVCGMYPAEYYAEYFPDAVFLDKSVFAVVLVIAVAILALYILSWIFSKKYSIGWMVFALVIFGIDTAGMLFFMGVSLDNVLDIVFHVWVIVSLAIGINACSKLKAMPAEPVEAVEGGQTEEEVGFFSNTGIIRVADINAKARTLLEADVAGHKVVYRRVKKINELVIDGNVYGELEAAVEFEHWLKARIDGHTIEAGFDGKLYSYIKLDGNTVAKKMRLI